MQREMLKERECEQSRPTNKFVRCRTQKTETALAVVSLLVTNPENYEFIKSQTCFFLSVFLNPVPTQDNCSILAAILLLQEAKFSKQDPRSGVSTLGLYSWLCQWPPWPFPSSHGTNQHLSESLVLFLHFVSPVSRAVPRCATHAMHNKSPVLAKGLKY